MKAFVSTALRAALPWVLLMLLMASHAHAQRLTPASYASDLKTVRALLQQPESQMDLGIVKLTVDRMTDPSIDVAAATKQIDDLVAWACFAASTGSGATRNSLNTTFAYLKYGKVRKRPSTSSAGPSDERLKRADFLALSAIAGLRASDTHAAMDDVLERMRVAVGAITLPQLPGDGASGEAAVIRMLEICRERIASFA